MSKEDAELECVLIVQEVLQALYAGAPSGSRVDIRTAAVGLDGRIAVENVNLLDVIDRLLREEQEKKARQAEKKQEKAAANPADKPPAVEPAPDAVPEISAPDDDDAERYENIMKVVPDRPVTFEYMPLWDVRRKVLSAYTCRIVSGGPGVNEAHTDEAEIYRRAAIDFLTVGRVTHEMRRLYNVNRRLLMHCPVHIDTLCDGGTWATYKILCERISHTPMRRELIFEIIGIAPDADRARIHLAANRLKSHCRHIVACTAPQEIDLGKFAGAPLAYLSMAASASRAAEKRLMKQMDDYAEAAQNLGFGAITTGLASLSMSVAAVGSGFDMIGGNAIHPAVARPEFVYRFEARNLLGKLSA
jgi:hypothetical protein